MASKRLAIQNQLVTILQGVSNVSSVSKKVIDPDKWSGENREIYVLAGQQMKTPASEDGALYSVLAYFQIMGFVKADTDVDETGLLNDACDSLIEDIEEALLEDTTLTTTTDAKQLIIEFDNPIYDTGNNKGVVFIGLHVLYYHEEDV